MMDATATVLVADDDSHDPPQSRPAARVRGISDPRGGRRRRGPGLRSPANPDAVLLDLKMPGRDGLEVLGELGRRWPTCR